MKRIFDAAEILQGKHNFSAFTSTRALIKDGDRNPNKYMNIQITRSSSFFDEYSPLQQEHFDYWDFFFVSRSFLYHQVMPQRLLRFVTLITVIAMCHKLWQ